MSTDFWPTLHSDPYALARLKKSVECCDIHLNHSVLDVGCHQEEARQFIPKGCDYVGLDHLKGDDFDGGFKLHQKFDRIICLEVLEHLKFPQLTLKSISEHLKDGGLIVISLPNEATLFHRIRSLLGTIDAEALQECGKHLHLLNLEQANKFLHKSLQVVQTKYYIYPSASSSRQAWLGTILKIFPDSFWQFLANSWPSMFARGFIFVCKNKIWS